MPSLPDGIKPRPHGSSGRTFSTWTFKDGSKGKRLLEWSTSPPEAFDAYITEVKRRIATGDEPQRLEEARTLKIEGSLQDGPRTILVYKCNQKPTSLREVIKHVHKPSVDDRRILASVIANQVRSLHVHYQLTHNALRADSFVFFLDTRRPDFSRPFIVDWAGAPSPMHQHPDYEGGRPAWFHDAWALMMVLSEIAEWKLLVEGDGGGGGEQAAGGSTVEGQDGGLRKRKV